MARARDVGDDESGVHGQIGRLAREMHGTRSATTDPDSVLQEVTAAAVALLDPVDHAGVTLLRTQRPRAHPRGTLVAVAETSVVAKQFAVLQHELGEGPCYETVWESTTVRIKDTSTDPRWPTLMTAVADTLPIRSSLSIELYVTDAEFGALNLHSETADAFDFDTEQLAINLATHAAIALSGAQRGEQFRSALATRDVIGQAKGMLMERFDIDAIDAFGLLQKLSQESNTRLNILAAQLIAADHPKTPHPVDTPQPRGRP